MEGHYKMLKHYNFIFGGKVEVTVTAASQAEGRQKAMETYKDILRERNETKRPLKST